MTIIIIMQFLCSFEDLFYFVFIHIFFYFIFFFIRISKACKVGNNTKCVFIFPLC